MKITASGCQGGSKPNGGTVPVRRESTRWVLNRKRENPARLAADLYRLAESRRRAR